MNDIRIRCNLIDYRKGYIEVAVGVHSKCVNVEMWNTAPSLDIDDLDVRDPKFPDDGVTSNTELELDIESARKLVDALQAAIQRIEASM